MDAKTNASLRSFGLSRVMMNTADSIHYGKLTDVPNRDEIFLHFPDAGHFEEMVVVIKRRLSGFGCRINVSVLLGNGKASRVTDNVEPSLALIEFWECLDEEISRRDSIEKEETSELVSGFLRELDSQ